MSAKAKSTARKVVLVETGGEWLKIAQAEPMGGGAAITRMSLVKTSGDSDAAAREMVAARKDFAIGTDSVVACLPRQVVNIRMLDLPSTDPAEIEDMVDLQIGKQTPYSRDEIEYDYRILGSSKPGYSRVMLVIVQRSILRSVYHVFEEAGIEVEKLSVSTEGILAWLPAAGVVRSGENLAVVDIDSYYTDFLVVGDSGLLYSRSILMGAEPLLDGDASTGVDRFVKEIANSLEACKAENRGVVIRKVLVSGAGVHLPVVVERLAHDLGMECKAVDSTQALKKLTKTPSLSEGVHRALSMTALTGAALDPDGLGFRLVPESVHLRKNLVTRAQVLTTMGMLIMAFLVTLSVIASLKLFFRYSQLRELKAQYAAMAADVLHVEERTAVLNLIRKRVGPETDALNLLGQVPPLLEGDIKLDTLDFDIQGGRFTVEGNAVSTKEIRSLVKNLEQAPLFLDVKESSTSLDRNSKRYKFQVSGSLERMP